MEYISKYIMKEKFMHIFYSIQPLLNILGTKIHIHRSVLEKLPNFPLPHVEMSFLQQSRLSINVDSYTPSYSNV